MKIVTAQQMQEIDRITINEMGIPGEALMYQAGRSVYDYIVSLFPEVKNIVIFSGTGNNGGDGFVTAYLLKNHGHSVELYLIGNHAELTSDAEIYYRVCINSGIRVRELTAFEKDYEIVFDKYDLIVDAMIGTGFKGAPRGIMPEIIKSINNSAATILSVDMPSGLPSDGIAPAGEVVKAHYTVTIGLPKISLATYPGKLYAGKVEVADIGFPSELLNSQEIKVETIDPDFIRENVEIKEDADTHKGRRGHLLLVGGFDGLEGAIIMSAMAALEVGTGLISLITTENSRNIIAGKIPELMTHPINLNYRDSVLNLNDYDNIEVQIENILDSAEFDAMIIGPGMGRSDKSFEIFDCIIKRLKDTSIEKVLIDGDGLFYLADYDREICRSDKIDYIITPHFKEASRILKKDVAEIKTDRLNSSIELARSLGAVAVLKGPATIVSHGDNSFINTSGNPSLATGGSGDVLSGIIGSLMLTHIPTPAAAVAGVFIHGLAADIYCRENRCTGIKATDIIGCIKKAKYESGI